MLKRTKACIYLRNILIFINFNAHRSNYFSLLSVMIFVVWAFNETKFFRKECFRCLLIVGIFGLKYFIGISNSSRLTKTMDAIAFLLVFSTALEKTAGIIIRLICTNWPFSMQFSTTHNCMTNTKSSLCISDKTCLQRLNVLCDF